MLLGDLINFLLADPDFKTLWCAKYTYLGPHISGGYTVDVKKISTQLYFI